jgi:hypothetical protein
VPVAEAGGEALDRFALHEELIENGGLGLRITQERIAIETARNLQAEFHGTDQIGDRRAIAPQRTPRQ